MLRNQRSYLVNILVRELLFPDSEAIPGQLRGSASAILTYL